MKLIDRLERRFGRMAIPHLMRYIAALYGIGILLSITNPMIYYACLALDPAKILHGQIWRLVTFLVCPPSSGIFFNLIALYLYYSLGETLENHWGTFRFNLYIFMGVLCEILASFVIVFLLGETVLLTPFYLNESLFLAFAATFPEVVFYFFGILPIRARWFGILIAVQFAFDFVNGGLATKICIALALLNFFVYFFMTRDYSRIDPREIRRKRDFRDAVKQGERLHGKPGSAQGRSAGWNPGGRAEGSGAKIVKMHPAKQGAMHRCAICGRTELDDPNLEFRYCSKCAGNMEYCMDHLYTHKHVTEEDLKNG